MEDAIVCMVCMDVCGYRKERAVDAGAYYMAYFIVNRMIEAPNSKRQARLNA